MYTFLAISRIPSTRTIFILMELYKRVLQYFVMKNVTFLKESLSLLLIHFVLAIEVQQCVMINIINILVYYSRQHALE